MYEFFTRGEEMPYVMSEIPKKKKEKRGYKRVLEKFTKLNKSN